MRQTPAWQAWVYYAAVALVLVVMISRLFNLRADFPVEGYRFVRDGVLYSDEGWYANNAYALMTKDSWYNEGDMNFAINLPILQFFYVIFFALFGVSIESARLTTIFSFYAVALFTFLVVRKLADSWTALLTVFIMGTNFFFFAYSRFAIAENTMLAFVMLSVYLALFSNGKRGWLFAGLSAVSFLTAMLAKTSAITAFPAYMITLFAVNFRSDAWGRLLKPAAACVIIGVPLVIHRIAIGILFPEDVRFFDAINVAMQIDLRPERIMTIFHGNVDRMKYMDRVMRFFFLFFLPLLLILIRSYRRSPLVLMSLFFLCCYLGVFSLYSNIQPRYWVAMSVGLSILPAVGIRCLVLEWRENIVAKILLPLASILIAVASANNIHQIYEYQANPKYTFSEEARFLYETMAADTGEERPVLLGHVSYTFALYENLYPVNDFYAPTPLETRLRMYRPTHLITEHPVDSYIDRAFSRHYRDPRSYRGRWLILNEFYDIEEIRPLEILEAHRGYDIWFYRLHEKPGPHWEENPPLEAAILLEELGIR